MTTAVCAVCIWKLFVLGFVFWLRLRLITAILFQAIVLVIHYTVSQVRRAWSPQQICIVSPSYIAITSWSPGRLLSSHCISPSLRQETMFVFNIRRPPPTKFSRCFRSVCAVCYRWHDGSLYSCAWLYLLRPSTPYFDARLPRSGHCVHHLHTISPHLYGSGVCFSLVW